MEVFSLEDDEYNGLFITQQSNEISDVSDVKNEEDSGVFLGGDSFDFGAPCVSLMPKVEPYNPQCKDISEDEFVDDKSINEQNNR